MNDRQSPPVLIIGAHRSGTTATARALELVGLQIGQHLDSHGEPRALQKLHEDYLRRVGAAWYNPQPFLNARRYLLLPGSKFFQKRESCTSFATHTRPHRAFADVS